MAESKKRVPGTWGREKTSETISLVFIFSALLALRWKVSPRGYPALGLFSFQGNSLMCR